MSSYVGVNPSAYLQYAKELASIDPVVAVYCKIYYADKIIVSKKQAGVKMNQSESTACSKLLAEIQKEQQAFALSHEEKKAHVEKYCKKMCDSLNSSIKSQSIQKNDLVSKLASAIDMINLLTCFGKLPEMWIKQSILINIF